MRKWLEIKNYLIANGFTPVAESQSPFFGNQYADLKMGDTGVHLSISRSFFTIEFFNRFHSNDAYDIEIIMAYFSEPYSRDNEMLFLKNHLAEVVGIFSMAYFPIVKPHLDKLEMERARRLFPGQL